jgi:hypothetical protein
MVDSSWWDQDETELWIDLTAGTIGAERDPELQSLFDDAMFNPDLSREERQEAYEMMIDYMWEAYALDFEDVFDWEAYREYYG